MIKAVVFDLDDTLISEKLYIQSGYWHVANVLSQKYSLDKKSIFHMLLDLFEVDSRYVFNRFLDQMRIAYSDDEVKELVDIYRNHVPVLHFFDDVLPCIHFLKSKGIKTGIITDGYKVSQKNKLKAIEADKYFDSILLTDELGREYWKPHPKAFEVMKNRLNVDFNQIMYVGDNPEKDFYISKIYPIVTVRICRDTDGIYKDRLYYQDVKETFTVSSLEQIPRILNIIMLEFPIKRDGVS